MQEALGSSNQFNDMQVNTYESLLAQAKAQQGTRVQNCMRTQTRSRRINGGCCPYTPRCDAIALGSLLMYTKVIRHAYLDP